MAERTAIIGSRVGLHARPAAMLATGLTDLDAEITVNGVDGKSVMLLMSLGLGQGRTITVEATGPDAQAAVDLVADLAQALAPLAGAGHTQARAVGAVPVGGS